MFKYLWLYQSNSHYASLSVISRVSQNLRILEFHNGYLTWLDPHPQVFCDFFSEFFDFGNLGVPAFKELTDIANYQIFDPRRDFLFHYLEQNYELHWISYNKSFNMNTNKPYFWAKIDIWSSITYCDYHKIERLAHFIICWYSALVFILRIWYSWFLLLCWNNNCSCCTLRYFRKLSL